MKRLYLKYICPLIILILLLIPSKTFAITSAGGYTIEGYNIDIVVNENNTYDVTEEIVAYFSSERHRNI